MSAVTSERVRRAIPIAALVLVSIAILASLFVASTPAKNTITYKNIPLDAWFYGSRTNFFLERTMRAAQEAFDALGTNACPFLLAKLESARGNGPLYCKLYRILPVWAQSRLPHPISGDDIKAIALHYLRQMRVMSAEQVQALADCVPRLRNPRLRMSGFQAMRMKHQTHPAFLGLCRKLLNDEHPGIQLEAAVWLGKSALASDPAEPRLFPILINAFESKEKRKSKLDLSGYTYQQWPPGGSRPIPVKIHPSLRAYAIPPDQALKDSIEDALLRLKPYLTQEQKDHLRRVEQTQREQSHK
jgi:hypothetical protein